MKNYLHRSSDNSDIGGVCGGLGEYFDVDPVFVRIGFAALGCFGMGLGVGLYFILWFSMPEGDDEEN